MSPSTAKLFFLNFSLWYNAFVSIFKTQPTLLILCSFIEFTSRIIVKQSKIYYPLLSKSAIYHVRQVLTISIPSSSSKIFNQIRCSEDPIFFLIINFLIK